MKRMTGTSARVPCPGNTYHTGKLLPSLMIYKPLSAGNMYNTDVTALRNLLITFTVT